MFQIGTMADWFGVGLIEGIRESERCGASGVQIYAADELDPRTVSKKRSKTFAGPPATAIRRSSPFAASWAVSVLKSLRTTRKRSITSSESLNWPIRWTVTS